MAASRSHIVVDFCRNRFDCGASEPSLDAESIESRIADTAAEASDPPFVTSSAYVLIGNL